MSEQSKNSEGRSEFQKAFDELREKVHAEMEKEIKERMEKNPLPTDEEVLIGAYLEQLEPQVREAIRVFYKKGYATQSSGFFERDGKELQEIDGYFDIDPETQKKLKAFNVAVGNFKKDYGWADDRGFVQFEPSAPDMEALKKQWDMIAEALPDLGKLAYSRMGSEYWMDRPDIQKHFFERRLALKAFDPEHEEIIKKEVERSSKLPEV